MGQYYMRPAAFGGLVLETKLKVTAITKAAHALVTAAYPRLFVGRSGLFPEDHRHDQINGRTGTVLSVADCQ
jgi:hypothetical protein